MTLKQDPLPGWEDYAHEPGTIARNGRMNVHFSSKTDMHSTPPAFFAELDEEFHFTLDVCATPENAKCSRFFSPETNGLLQQWGGACWMNPPYGAEIIHWMKKAYESSRDGATVVCLVPARTDTTWWHQFVTKANEIRFVRGRLKFGNAEHSAPFPSAVVIFRRDDLSDRKENLHEMV